MKKLQIKNYKCFQEIDIDNLKQVNLFTGKNNTGKTTVLEAVSLCIMKGNLLNWIIQLLNKRGEKIPKRNYENSTTYTETILKSVSSLFYKRKIDFNEDSSIQLLSDSQDLSIRFVYFTEEAVNIDKEENKIIGKKRVVLNESEINRYGKFSYGLEIKSNSTYKLIELDNNDIFSFRTFYPVDSHSFQFIDHKGDDITNNANLWDLITLSPKEELVIEALKIIEPDITRLSFIGEDGSRYPIVKLKNSDEVYPLKSMGDGINRMLNLILALVNSENGFLLIDEIENGLHFSVQEKLWEIIFKMSKKLNVQVFATTHSNDSIITLAATLEKNEDFDGSIFRLHRTKEKIIAFNFDKKEIAIAAKQEINLR